MKKYVARCQYDVNGCRPIMRLRALSPVLGILVVEFFSFDLLADFRQGWKTGVKMVSKK